MVCLPACTTSPLCLCLAPVTHTRACRYVDVRTQAGFTAMHFAVHASCQQALAALLNNGANPLLSSLFDCLDGINSCKGTTALHLAARFGNEPVVLQLLKAYVSPQGKRKARAGVRGPRVLHSSGSP